MDRVYEDDKTLVLAKARGFHTVVSPKKNRKFHRFHNKQLYKQRNSIKEYFLRLKRFRRVLFVMTNLILFLSLPSSLFFIFELLFM